MPTQILIASALICVLSTSLHADEAAEPPLVFEVTIGDQTLSVGEGQTSKVTGSFDDAKFRINIRPHREFTKAGVSFRYPREYVYEADVADPGFKSWTVEGSNTVIMLFVIEGEFKAADYAEGVIPQFGRDNAKISNPRDLISLGLETYSGVEVTIDVGGQLLTQQAFEIPLPEGRGGLLVVQDSLTDAGNHSKEYESTLKQLAASFVLEK